MIDTKLITDCEVENANEYPDFPDAFISWASFEDRDLTDSELDELNEDSSFVYEKCLEEWF